MSLKFPADFEKCVKNGGRVRTINPKKGEYLHVCYDKAGSHSGEVKTKQEASEVTAYLSGFGYVEKDGEMAKASETQLKRLMPQIELNEKNFSSKNPTSEIEVLHAGEWEHPQYGMISITEEDIDKFIASFNNKVRKVDIAVDQEHEPDKGAAGWYKSLRKVFEDGKIKLKAVIEWTKLGTQLIKDGIFKYFSADLDFEYEDQETHERFENVLLGGALTNRPYFKSLAPVALSENMYAGFTSRTLKGGEKNMTKDELKAKLAEDAEFALPEDASDEDKNAYEEAKAELAKEAEEKAEADKKTQEEADAAAKAEADKVIASEKFILKADHVKEMNELKSRLGVAESKLRFKEISEEVAGYVFSESNPSGTILPKNKKVAVDLLLAATPKVATLFAEFVKGLPVVSAKLFTELGGDGGKDQTKVEKQKEAVEAVIKEYKTMKYSEALKIASRQKPELFK